MLMRDGCNFSDIHQGQCGVGGRLDPDELGIWADQVRDVNLDGWAECDLDIVCSRYLGKVAVGSSVHI